MQIKLRWIPVIAFGYLILPFIIFCLGFLKYSIGIPASLIIIWVYYQIIRNLKNNESISFTKKEIIIFIIIVVLWVWLSGVGGFAFQNWDHHTRNAILHDLIDFSWPVIYSSVSEASSTFITGNDFALVYYIGYWLPSALIGKLFGFLVARVALFLWTCLSVLIITATLKVRTGYSIYLSLAILIFFSGMDVIGALIRSLISSNFSIIWPPISHLEWWAIDLQFSSFTTQLFWVFNQAIPTWLCMSLFLSKLKPEFSLFIWSLCLFYSPIPAVGMLPFVITDILLRLGKSLSMKAIAQKKRIVSIFIKELARSLRVQIIPSILGFIIVSTISLSYFANNHESSLLRFQQISFEFIFIYILFLFLEGFLFWIFLINNKDGKIMWIIAGVVLFSCPLIEIGKGIDFTMRASIPLLFMLMVWSGEKLREKKNLRVQLPILFILLIGAVTPLYEMNRSIYRTSSYLMNIEKYSYDGSPNPSVELQVPAKPELDHPFTLVADDVQSIKNLSQEFILNYIAPIKQEGVFQILRENTQ